VNADVANRARRIFSKERNHRLRARKGEKGAIKYCEVDEPGKKKGIWQLRHELMKEGWNGVGSVGGLVWGSFKGGGKRRERSAIQDRRVRQRA